MVRILLYAIIGFALYRMFFSGKRLSGEQRTRVRQDGSNSAAQGGRQRAADEEGEYVDYEEVD